MKTNHPELWNQLQAAYRPQTPDLDTASIMGAIRLEAAAHPLRRVDPGLAAAIPTWVCAMAASLAILTTAGVVGRSVALADRQISQAWMHSIQPDQFEQSILSLSGSSL